MSCFKQYACPFLPELFAALEEQSGGVTYAENMGISNYGISMPTLEEVFLKLGTPKMHIITTSNCIHDVCLLD